MLSSETILFRWTFHDFLAKHAKHAFSILSTVFVLTCSSYVLVCVADITRRLPALAPPATVINSVNKWKMTRRLAGPHHWPHSLLEWPSSGLTKSLLISFLQIHSIKNDSLLQFCDESEHYIRGRGRESSSANVVFLLLWCGINT